MKAVALIGLALAQTPLTAASPAAITSTTMAPSTCAATAKPSYSSFTYDRMTINRYPTPVTSPLKLATPFAPHFHQVSTLLPTRPLTTTYSLNPAATSSHDGKYGQSAYAALWASYAYSNPTLPFSTTVSPTPVALSELIYPPALYTPCPSAADTCVDCYNLPADFVWGVAGSAFQIEGALQSEGRGPSFLDIIGNNSGQSGFLPGPNADGVVGNMNYYLYKQDIVRIAAMGIKYYSFSIAWSRIVPFGIAGSPINQRGLDHYDDVINFCLKHGIQPIVTLVHFDPPVSVDYNDYALLTNSFLYYAKQVMTRYSDRVAYWETFNEPNLGLGVGSYNAYTNILMAHSQVYHWYKKNLKGTGQISLKWANNLAIPLTGSAADVHAAQRYQDFIVGVLATPLFLGQQYPASVLETKALNLTPLTPAQIKYIHGSIDFLSFDPYVAQFASAPEGGVAACAADPTNAAFPQCAITTNTQANGWYMGQRSNAYAYIAPQYVRQQLGALWNNYRPAGILISEFGFNPFDESLKEYDGQRYDLERSLYYQGFLTEMLKAIYEDGVNVIGALAWSFIDNNEFGSYANQYGLQLVNRTSPTLERSYKRSFFDYVDFFHKYVSQ